jgi:hypothetical protein
VNFFSCKKENGNCKIEHLKGTTWESDYFESITLSDPRYYFSGGEYIMYTNVTISFKSCNDADITINIQKIYDIFLQVTYYPYVNIHESATYVFKEKELILRLNESNQNWSGIANKDKMTLSKIFGKTVELVKIN